MNYRPQYPGPQYGFTRPSPPYAASAFNQRYPQPGMFFFSKQEELLSILSFRTYLVDFWKHEMFWRTLH